MADLNKEDKVIMNAKSLSHFSIDGKVLWYYVLKVEPRKCN